MSTIWINTNGGSWNDSLNWSNGVPSPTSQAIFDAASFAANGKVITASALMQCQGLDVSAADQTFTIQSAVYGLELYGDFVGSLNCTFAMTGTAYVYSKATMTLTTNGKSLTWNRWYIDGVGITVTIGDNCNIGSTWIYLTNGTLYIGDKTLTTTSWFSTAAGTKTLTFTIGTLNCAHYDCVSTTNFTLNCGTSTINVSNVTFSGAAKAYYNVNLSYNGAVEYYGNNTILNLTRTGGVGITNSIIFFHTLTVTNNLTITGANSTSQRVLLQSSVIGTSRTITCNGTTNITNCDFQDITLAGTANRDFSAQTDIGNCGGNSGITFPPAIDCYIKHTSGAMSVSNVAKWVTTDGGSTQARVPLPQDRAWGTANSFTGSSTVTMDCPRIGSIDLSGVGQSVGWTLANAISCYGNYVLGSNITQSGNQILTLAGRGNFNINTYGKTIYRLIVNAYMGNYLNLSDINISLYFVTTIGVFDFNGYNLNAYSLYCLDGITYCRNGVFTLFARDVNNAEALVVSSSGKISANLSIFILNPESGSLISRFAGGGAVFNRIQLSNGGSFTGNFDITGSNTFNQIKIDPGRKVRFAAGTTQNIASLDAVGSAAAPITISSVTAAEHTLNYTGSQWVQCDWLNLTNSKVLPANRWFAGKNSVNGGGNTNWNFKRYIITPIISIIRKF